MDITAIVVMSKLFAYASIFAGLTAIACGQPLVKNANSLNQGAGFVFVCKDDQTVFLGKRSRYVNHSGTWNGLGGQINPGESPKEAAIREVKEEAGSMPNIDSILATIHYEQNGFDFITFIVNVTKEEKRRWRPKRNFEHDEFRWFRKLPDHLHPGLKWALKQYVLSH